MVKLNFFFFGIFAQRRKEKQCHPTARPLLMCAVIIIIVNVYGKSFLPSSPRRRVLVVLLLLLLFHVFCVCVSYKKGNFVCVRGKLPTILGKFIYLMQKFIYARSKRFGMTTLRDATTLRYLTHTYLVMASLDFCVCYFCMVFFSC